MAITVAEAAVSTAVMTVACFATAAGSARREPRSRGRETSQGNPHDNSV